MAQYVLNDEILYQMSDVEFDMVENQVIAYQERHNSLCAIIKTHNELYND